MRSSARVKHNLKRIDRLLSNSHLGAERFSVYQALARRLMGALHEPLIVVDWSDLGADRRWQVLRAALPIGGRCLTLYEEIHPLIRFGNPRVHRAFLAKRKALLPEDVKPILITDAGFRAPWFKAVNCLDWHWIGRIRNRTSLRPQAAEAWIGCKTLYAQAHARAQSLGAYDIVRSNPVACCLHLIKRRKKHRLRKSVFGQPVRCAQSLEKARAQREPWLLAASPSLAHLSAAQIVSIYAKRMPIEEAFRDLKCARYGLGFSLNLSRSRERLAALLIIALLAFFVLWLIRQQALARGLPFRYQSNTGHSRPVLSPFHLASQLVRRATDQLLARDLPHLLLLIRPPLPLHNAL